jgi:hypothetical protein
LYFYAKNGQLIANLSETHFDTKSILSARFTRKKPKKGLQNLLVDANPGK